MIRLDTIERAVAEEFRLSPTVLRSARRDRDVVTARHVCWFIAHQAGRSLSWLADRYRNDHTTVGDAIRKITCRIETSAQLNDIVVRLRGALLDQPPTKSAGPGELMPLATRIDSELTRISADLRTIGIGARLPAAAEVPPVFATPRQLQVGNLSTAARSDRQQTRACLSCSKPFSSQGAHNRMCPSCRAEGPDLVSAYGG